MKYVFLLLFSLLSCVTLATAIAIDGYCVLDYQWSHAGTKVKFLRVSPSAVTDSVVTDATGYFAKAIVPGIYHVIRSHDLYRADTLFAQTFTANTTLVADTLYRPIAGTLSGNLGPGVFRVRGNLTVSTGNTLTIQPATKLIFDSLYALTVNGTLLAVGTAADSIVFTSLRSAGEHWRGIRIVGGGTSSNLAYCAIEQALAPDTAWGLACRNASPTVAHCTIRHCSGGRYGYENWTWGYFGHGGGVWADRASPLFTDCAIDSNGDPHISPAGAWATSNSFPTFVRCTFDGNIGNGVHVDSGGHATVTDCDFANNSSYGAYNRLGVLTASDCQFHNNSVGLGLYGPAAILNCVSQNNNVGIGCGYAAGTLENCTISQNRGTGVQCYGAGTSFTFTNCRITRNVVRNGQGGGVYCAEFAAPQFVNCAIDSNKSLPSGYNSFPGGGAFCTNSAAPIFRNCTFIRDSAMNTGGAIAVESQAHPSFINCTVFSCYAGWGTYPAAVSIRDATPILTNTIIAYSCGYGLAFDGNCRDSQIQYCNLYGNSSGAMYRWPYYYVPSAIGERLVTNVNGDSADIYLNIFEEPMLVDTATGNLNLAVGSPCIDAGDPTQPLDPDETIADIGARIFLQDLTSSVKSLAFGDVAVGAAAARSVKLYNRTGSPITVYSVLTDSPVFSTDFLPENHILSPADSLSITVTFNPTVNGAAAGRLHFLSDAIYNDSLFVVLSGIGGLVPAPVRGVTLQVQGTNAALAWSPVDTTIHGNPMIADAYLVYFAERIEGPYWFLGLSTDTTYIHEHVTQFAASMYYEVTAYVGSLSQLQSVVTGLGLHPERDVLRREMTKARF